MNGHSDKQSLRALQTLSNNASVLALAADSNCIYAGTDAGVVLIWDCQTFSLKATLRGHAGGVLALELDEQKAWLFSSSSDKSIRIWSTKSLSPLFTIDTASSGDIFSLAWLPELHTLYMGSQDATISWIRPPEAPSATVTPQPYPHRYHKFFDSQSVDVLARTANMTRSSSGSSLASSPPAQLTIPSTFGPHTTSSPYDKMSEPLSVSPDNVMRYEHAGYVYALCIARSKDKSVLVSGSGDEDVKVWACFAERIELLATLSGDNDAVLTVCARESTVFAGHQGGVIKIWDLETFQSIRTIKAHNEDILCLSVSLLDGDLFSGSAAGEISRWSKSFGRKGTWQAHSNIILASRIKRSLNSISAALITGSGDCTVKIWDITPEDGPAKRGATGLKGRLFTYLGQFITFRTISSEETREECRQGALWLKRTLAELGADASLLPGAPGRNPLVLATFKATASTGAKRRVLFYGHYDVVKPGAREKWDSDPFELSARNEYVYGRGVADNKGPVIAVACAASQLAERKALDVDVVMLVEGEEEANSTGFQEAVKKHREQLGHIDVILLSNSSSILGKPCVTWGLRGVVRASLEVTSEFPDTHSGLSGGVVAEPLVDLTRVLGSLCDVRSRVTVPHFYDSVKPMEKTEAAFYDEIAELGLESCDSPVTHTHVPDRVAALRQTWREPSISFHKIDVSGPAHSTVIPARARATVSIRIVPDQSLEVIVEGLKKHCHALFAALQSPNKLEVRIDHTADWWLGDPTSPYNRAMGQIVEDVWGSPPLWIREGGSVPGIALLERELGCGAIHLPMAESDDAAHLPNERIRILNLERGMSIVQQWLVAVSKL